MLDATIKRFLHQQDALIEILHAAQNLFGCLQDDLLLYVAAALRLPPSRVYGVATFYHLFSLKPQGAHTCVVCTGTACYVKGANNLLSAIQAECKIGVGETTSDGLLSLLTARCIAPCGIAPIVVYDGTVAGKQTVETALNQVKGWLRHGPQ